jgi:hypothetical protein
MINEIEYKGKLWGVVFFHGDPRLEEIDFSNLLRTTIDFHHSRSKEASVKGRNYEGKLATDRKIHLLGSYCGRKYDTKLKGDFGMMDISFLLMEPIRADLN